MSLILDKELAQELGILNFPKVKHYNNVSIRCPFHDDSENSASISFKKRVFNCHAGCGGMTIDEVKNKLSERINIQIRKSANGKGVKDLGTRRVNTEEPTEDREIEERPKSRKLHYIKRTIPRTLPQRRKQVASYLKSRGITPKNIPIEYDIVTDKTSEWNGYILFKDSLEKCFVGRAFYPGADNKYRSNKGPKSLFWINKNDDSIVWIVEGIFDGLTLSELGYSNIACVLGSEIADKVIEEIAYSLRDKFVIILFDRDLAGYKGSEKLNITLKRFGVDTFSPELPKGVGKDINEFLTSNREACDTWLNDKFTKFTPSSKIFIKRVFDPFVKEKISRIFTGVQVLDDNLTLADGVHVIGGNPGVGKSSVCLSVACHNVENGKRGLVNSCELSLLQCWSRVASRESEYSWSQIEQSENWEILEEDTKKYLDFISEGLDITIGLSVKRVLQLAPKYDFIICDYLQRMPGTASDDQFRGRYLLNKGIEAFGDLGRDFHKVIILVSSIARDSYGDATKYGFKETGQFEFVGASASRLIKQKHSNIWLIQKSTRDRLDGERTRVDFRVNYPHTRILDIKK